MTQARQKHSLWAWMLFLSVLFSALHCAVGHGEVNTVPFDDAQLHHQHHQPDSHHGHHADATAHIHASADTGCEFASPFSAIILAAFFGLLGLLALDAVRPLPVWQVPRQPRSHWPPANPRASPVLFAVS